MNMADFLRTTKFFNIGNGLLDAVRSVSIITTRHQLNKNSVIIFVWHHYVYHTFWPCNACTTRWPLIITSLTFHLCFRWVPTCVRKLSALPINWALCMAQNFLLFIHLLHLKEASSPDANHLRSLPDLLQCSLTCLVWIGIKLPEEFTENQTMMFTLSLRQCCDHHICKKSIGTTWNQCLAPLCHSPNAFPYSYHVWQPSVGSWWSISWNHYLHYKR